MTKANKSTVRLLMMKKKISALTWCVGMTVLSHWTPAREAQSTRFSFISTMACSGYCNIWGEGFIEKSVAEQERKAPY